VGVKKFLFCRKFKHRQNFVRAEEKSFRFSHDLQRAMARICRAHALLLGEIQLLGEILLVDLLLLDLLLVLVCVSLYVCVG
jgi:hypothetical protein